MVTTDSTNDRSQEELDSDFDWEYKHICQQCDLFRDECQCLDEWEQFENSLQGG